MQDNEKQHEQQPVDDGMNQNGDPTGLHVHEVDGMLPPRQLEDDAGAQEREESGCDDRRSPILHSAANHREFLAKKQDLKSVRVLRVQSA